MTVTCLRSPSKVAAGATTSSRASAWPHPLQNFCPTGFAVPQSAHSTVALSAVPHSPQNRAASTFSVPHFGQVIVLRAVVQAIICEHRRTVNARSWRPARAPGSLDRDRAPGRHVAGSGEQHEPDPHAGTAARLARPVGRAPDSLRDPPSRDASRPSSPSTTGSVVVLARRPDPDATSPRRRSCRSRPRGLRLSARRGQAEALDRPMPLGAGAPAGGDRHRRAARAAHRARRPAVVVAYVRDSASAALVRPPIAARTRDPPARVRTLATNVPSEISGTTAVASVRRAGSAVSARAGGRTARARRRGSACGGRTRLPRGRRPRGPCTRAAARWRRPA